MSRKRKNQSKNQFQENQGKLQGAFNKEEKYNERAWLKILQRSDESSKKIDDIFETLRVKIEKEKIEKNCLLNENVTIEEAIEIILPEIEKAQGDQECKYKTEILELSKIVKTICEKGEAEVSRIKANRNTSIKNAIHGKNEKGKADLQKSSQVVNTFVEKMGEILAQKLVQFQENQEELLNEKKWLKVLQHNDESGKKIDDILEKLRVQIEKEKNEKNWLFNENVTTEEAIKVILPEIEKAKNAKECKYKDEILELLKIVKIICDGGKEEIAGIKANRNKSVKNAIHGNNEKGQADLHKMSQVLDETFAKKMEEVLVYKLVQSKLQNKEKPYVEEEKNKEANVQDIKKSKFSILTKKSREKLDEYQKIISETRPQIMQEIKALEQELETIKQAILNKYIEANQQKIDVTGEGQKEKLLEAGIRESILVHNIEDTINKEYNLLHKEEELNEKYKALRKMSVDNFLCRFNSNEQKKVLTMLLNERKDYLAYDEKKNKWQIMREQPSDYLDIPDISEAKNNKENIQKMLTQFCKQHLTLSKSGIGRNLASEKSVNAGEYTAVYTQEELENIRKENEGKNKNYSQLYLPTTDADGSKEKYKIEDRKRAFDVCKQAQAENQTLLWSNRLKVKIANEIRNYEPPKVHEYCSKKIVVDEKLAAEGKEILKEKEKEYNSERLRNCLMS